MGFGCTASLLRKDRGKEKILEFYQDFGISLRNIWAEKRPEADACAPSGYAGPSGSPGSQSVPDSGNHAIFLLHGDSNKAPAPIALDSEAFGIQALFNLAGPALDALERVVTLVVDEVNLGLHPHAVESLISMFCDQETNAKNAHIIFTTHDPMIVLTTYVERDQVWLMEKSGDDWAALLRPRPSFKNRNGLGNFVNDYIQGRYGGVPNDTRRQV